MNQIATMFAAATVTSDADVSGIASALADISTGSRLMAEWAELQAAEIVAEESGDEATIMRAMDASDAWCERTEALRVRLYGRGGWPQ
jgi:hypothetical protein